MKTIKYLDEIFIRKSTREDTDEVFGDYQREVCPKKNPDAIKILVYIGCFGTSYWRMAIPLMELMKSPEFNIRICNLRKEEDVAWADILVFQRAANSTLVSDAIKAKSRGKKVVVDLDDCIHNHPTYNPGKQMESKPYLEEMTGIMYLADAITLSTDFLATLYKNRLKMQKPHVVLPNVVKKEHWETTLYRNDEWVNICWAGTNTHSADLEVVSQAIKQCIDKYPFVNLFTVGWDGIYKHQADKTVYYQDYFGTIPQNRRFHFNWIDHCHRVVKYVQFADIGIAPLVENDFNRAKSAVKYLEYGMCGVPTIATDLEPYRLGDNSGITLIKNNKFSKWLKALEELIENEEKRRALGSTSYQNITENLSIDTNVKLWYNFYKDLMNGTLNQGEV